MESTALALFLALLSILPHSRATPCLHERAQAIVRMAAVAEQDRGVPAGVLLVVGLLETHCGCDIGEGGGWGAPIDPRHRHTAGTSDTAARILQHSLTACGTWERAIGRFRSGLCAPFNPVHQAYVRRAMGLIRREYATAGVAVPALR